ncbi:MAG TPA: molybdopterin dinucleotide binding domain-containing protein [Chloroflexota bacterium]|nr:molybdopterin dinucleotide binding domain-containing protein [Chloroflexota bacterium]
MHELQAQSPAQIPADTTAGFEQWYASTCRECGAGCGVIVRVLDGRAKKIEGNPAFPTNQGKLCARGQAGVQALYHPDRIAGPLRQRGERGSADYETLPWDQALDDVAGHLRPLLAAGRGGEVLLLTGPLHGAQARVVTSFAQATGIQHVAHDPLERRVERAAISRVFGQDRLPHFDLANSAYVLSFGADFLGTWLAPVAYGVAYGEFRQGRPGQRGYFVQVEPRLSATGASADEWLPVRPGAEGLLALALAQVIATEGLGDAGALGALTGGGGAAALGQFAPERVADATGVDAARIRALARAFARGRPALAIGGGSAAAQTNGLFNLQAIYALNYLVGSVGVPGGVRFNPAPPLQDAVMVEGASFADWQALAERLRSGAPRPVSAVLVCDANPVYALPAALGFRNALAQVPYIASFSGLLDETSALADVLLPSHVGLEDWGSQVPDPGPGYATVGFQQPVVNPFLDTHGFADTLLALAARLGGAARQALPWDSGRDVLRDQARQLQGQGGSPSGGADFETFWIALLQQGGWWNPSASGPGAAPAPALALTPQAAQFAGDEADFPYHLLVYPSPALGAGEAAHLPWAQATPDPMTSATWSTWLEVNPATAARLGVSERDVVTVESPQGAIDVPVYVYPAIPPDVVAIPLGQGHTAYGRYAAGRGANPLAILAPLVEPTTGALAWAATRVRLRKAGRRGRIPKLEGTWPPYLTEESEFYKITRT